MDRFSLSVLMGFIIGIVNILPMIFKRLPQYTTVASFIHYFIATIVIINIDIPIIPWWIEGGLLGLILMLPMLIHVGHSDKKPLMIIAANAVILGSAAGVISHFLLDQ